jgi:hypothetical protein
MATTYPVQTETFHDGGFMVSEANGHRSRDKIVVTGGKVKAGTVLGQSIASTAIAAAVAGNTGNGAMGAIAVGGAAKSGVYMLSIIEPAANGGEFVVEDPDGVNVGNGTVGVAFNMGGLAFTLADGATDFAAGDQIKITVASGTRKHAALNLAATDGTAIAAGILFGDVDATSADKSATGVKRACEVNGSELIWPAGASAEQIAVGIQQLAALGIIVR